MDSLSSMLVLAKHSDFQEEYHVDAKLASLPNLFLNMELMFIFGSLLRPPDCHLEAVIWSECNDLREIGGKIRSIPGLNSSFTILTGIWNHALSYLHREYHSGVGSSWLNYCEELVSSGYVHSKGKCCYMGRRCFGFYASNWCELLHVDSLIWDGGVELMDYAAEKLNQLDDAANYSDLLCVLHQVFVRLEMMHLLELSQFIPFRNKMVQRVEIMSEKCSFLVYGFLLAIVAEHSEVTRATIMMHCVALLVSGIYNQNPDLFMCINVPTSLMEVIQMRLLSRLQAELQREHSGIVGDDENGLDKVKFFFDCQVFLQGKSQDFGFIGYTFVAYFGWFGSILQLPYCSLPRPPENN